MDSHNGYAFKNSSSDVSCSSISTEPNGSEGIAQYLPTEAWEKILMFSGYESWNNIAKAYSFVYDIIDSMKMKEIERCKRSLKRIPFEYFIELTVVFSCLKITSKMKVIESYVNHWKYHYPEKLKLSHLNYNSDVPATPVDYMNVSGRWVFLFSNGTFTMIHLDTHAQYSFPSPIQVLYVEKFVFLKSSRFSVKQCQSIGCWCNGDLAHDYVQIHVPRFLRIMQSGSKAYCVNLHSFSEEYGVDKSLPGYHHVTCGKFRLSFSPNFGFDEGAFASRIRKPDPLTFVFDGLPGEICVPRILLNVSMCPVPPTCDTFRANLLILDNEEQCYRLLFLDGPKVAKSIKVPPLLQAHLYRGSTLVGLCPDGQLSLITHKVMHTMNWNLTQSFTCLDLRGNLLVTGTQDGAVVIYRLRGQPIDLPDEMKHIQQPKRIQVVNEKIIQLCFIPSAAAPELLLLTISYKLYHIKLVSTLSLTKRQLVVNTDPFA